MSSTRGPVRHGKLPARPSRTVTDALTTPEDLQRVFAALARRAKLPPTSDTRAADVLRTAGIPLLVAAVVAGQPTAASAASIGAEGGVPDSTPWTVTIVNGPAGTPHAASGPARATRSPRAARSSEAATRSHHPAARQRATRTTQRPAAGTGTPPASTSGTTTKPARPTKPAKPAKPTKPATAAAAPTTQPTARPAQQAGAAAPGVTYRVRPGDTLSEIAARSGCSLAAVLKSNRLTPDSVIHPGQLLTLPVTGSTSTPSTGTSANGAAANGAASNGSGGRTYVVRRGDTLTAVARRFDVPLQKVLALNDLTMNSTVRVGTTLTLPPAPARTAPAQAAPVQHTYPPAVMAAARANRQALARRAVPTQARARVMVEATARRLGVDPRLALAVAYHESGFQQRVVSDANAVGIMQVIPSSGRWASGVVGRSLNLLDAQDNITAGVILLRSLVANAPDEPTAIAGYYQGLSSVRRDGPYDDTRRYVANVQALKPKFTPRGVG